MKFKIRIPALKTAILALAAGCSMSSLADDVASGVSIVDEINSSGGSVYVSQPAELDFITNNSSAQADDQNQAHGRMMGYRIQIYSDNNVRTARAGAENRRRSVGQALPDARTYIIFESPYWRVKVGDYRTYGEADEAMQELLQQYPSFASDAKIVKERINVSRRSNTANQQ